MKPEQIPVQIDTAEGADDGPKIGLVDVLTWLGEAKRRIAINTVVAGVAAIGFTMLLTPVYTARVTLTAPAQNQSQGASAALSALGSLGALGGLGTSLAGKTPDEMYVAVLKSDSVLRALNTQFKLQERYELDKFEVLRNYVKNLVTITADKKSGVIQVEVDDKDPKFAADLANGYATEVNKVLARMALTEAQQRRGFFELQLKDSKDNLAKAEQSLREVQEKSGLVVLDKQAEAIIEAVASLRSRIITTEVALRVLRSTSTEANPDVRRRTTELAALRSELARMETASAIASASAASGPSSGFDTPTSTLPAAAVEFMRAIREVKLQEALLANMMRQYEVARLDSAKDAPSLQQIDVAEPPDHKSKPKRAPIVFAVTFATLFLSAAWAVWRRYRSVMSATDPLAAQAWSALTNAWRIRRKS